MKKKLTFNHVGKLILIFKKHLPLVLILLLVSASINAQEKLFEQDSLKLISAQFKFTEGASVDQKGNVFFTDQPNDQIWKYSLDGKLSLFLHPAGRANGTYFDKKGNLIACADDQNELWQIDAKGKSKIIFKNPPGQALNGPNDLWIDAQGGIYFTDPYYQRDYWSRTKPEIVGERVYYLPKGQSKLIALTDDLVRPNGIVGTPDGKILYVGDASAEKVYRYLIQNDGQLKDKKLIISQRTDGMTLDNLGNLYLTGKAGVTIFDPLGTQIGQIRIPENHTANVCFGGKNRDILFITASKSLYKIKMSVKGVE